jgi:hypothetical protein
LEALLAAVLVLRACCLFIIKTNILHYFTHYSFINTFYFHYLGFTNQLSARAPHAVNSSGSSPELARPRNYRAGARRKVCVRKVGLSTGLVRATPEEFFTRVLRGGTVPIYPWLSFCL